MKMRTMNGSVKERPAGRRSARDVEERFLRLYSRWQETHDLSLRKRLFVRLRLLVRTRPDFDLRSWFNRAF